MDRDRFFDRLRELKSTGQIISNAYFTATQWTDLLENDQVKVHEADGLLALTLEEERIVRLYFVATDRSKLSQLPEICAAFPTKPVVSDVIGKHGDAGKMAVMLIKNAKFSLYDIYPHMVNKTPIKRDVEGATADVEFATREVLDDIYIRYTETFDVLTDHLPTKTDLEKAIDNKELVIVRIENEVVGFQHYEKRSRRNYYWRSSIIDNRYRGKKLDGIMWNHFLDRIEEGAMVSLWHLIENDTVSNIRGKVGFIHDGIVDYIMVWKGGR